MALFGSTRDITFFKGITKEVVEDVVSTSIGYYKIMLSDTPTNVYGEAMNKYYIGPVLINCLIERGDMATTQGDVALDINRSYKFRFFKDHLIDANVVPERGDVIMWNETYFECDNIIENQLIWGKDNQYAYQPGLENFGNSFSIIVEAHYTSPDKLGINKNRL
jgi:hypothetical protein